MNAEAVKEVSRLLAEKKKIVVTAHKAPDGDAIGSILGLAQFLRAKGHDVECVVPDAYPNFLKWMPGQKDILKYNRHWTPVKRHFKEADIIFLLDYNALNRIGEMGVPLQQSGAVKIMIDHHQQPEHFPDYVFSDLSACSTAQMVWELIDAMGETDLINTDGASCLYTGIMTDTGSFRFPATSSKTHRIVAELIDKGVNHARIHECILDTNSYDRMKLTGYALGEKMQYLPEFNTTITSLDAAELERFHYKKGDTEGLVNMGLSIDGVVFSVFISEQENIVKLSFRSQGSFSVNEFAKTHFNGGGHRNAAGGHSNDNVQDTVAHLMALLPQYKEALNR